MHQSDASVAQRAAVLGYCRFFSYPEAPAQSPEGTALKENIGSLMSEIYSNNHELSKRLKEKNRVFAQIQAKLDFMQCLKKHLSENHIRLFAQFTMSSAQKGAQLSKALEGLLSKEHVAMVQKELLHSQADYTLIQQSLTAICRQQQEALKSLQEINGEAFEMLQLLANMV